MRTINKPFLILISITVFLVFLRWLFARVRHLNAAIVFAQLIDFFGFPSTLYMQNISCTGCNHFAAPYLIEPRQTAYCTHDKPIFLMVLVISPPGNYHHRMAIRRSWGSISAHREKSIRTFFACGQTANSATQEMLENEAKQWHDVLQIDINDNYKTLTNKTVASIMWAIGYCGRHFTFLLKTDDDSFNVLQRFVEYLDNLAGAEMVNFAFVGGYCSSGETPHRDHKHRWFVPHSSYPAPVFPLHAKGRAYVISNAAALRIAAVSSDVLFNTMEDVFITGVCRAVTGIGCTPVPGIPRTSNPTTCDVNSGKVISIHYVDPARQTRWWNSVNAEITAKQTCDAEIPKLYIVVTSVALVFFIFFFYIYRRKHFSLLLLRKL